MFVRVHYKNPVRQPVEVTMVDEGGVKEMGGRHATFSFLDVVNHDDKRMLISLSSIETIEEL
jgi:hypothetical protein